MTEPMVPLDQIEKILGHTPTIDEETYEHRTQMTQDLQAFFDKYYNDFSEREFSEACAIVYRLVAIKHMLGVETYEKMKHDFFEEAGVIFDAS